MPYITPREREFVDRYGPHTPGQLTFYLYRAVLDYFRRTPMKFADMASIKGILVSVGTEFDTRICAPYEAHKQQENGDVVPYEETPSVQVEMGGKQKRPKPVQPKGRLRDLRPRRSHRVPASVAKKRKSR